MDLSTIEKYDSQKIYKVYDRWAEIARKSFESDLEPINFEGIDHIVFSGMGGSGSIGDMFSSILSKSKIHVNVVKGYVLPETVDCNTLVVITSVSGDTVETLSVLKYAHKIGSKIIAFSSGGKIKEYCVKNKINHRTVSMYHSPRASFTNYLYSVLKVMHSTLEIKQKDILESISELEKLHKKINSSNLTDSNTSLNLATWISGIPVVYYPFGLKSAAIRFKNSFQENDKMHVFVEDVIEVCHNGIVSWETNSIVKPILLRGSDDNIKTKERYDVIKKYFKENNIEYEEIFSVKGNILSKLVNLIYFFDYTTIYFAILSEIDPSPVNSINYIKSKLR